MPDRHPRTQRPDHHPRDRRLWHGAWKRLCPHPGRWGANRGGAGHLDREADRQPPVCRLHREQPLYLHTHWPSWFTQRIQDQVSHYTFQLPSLDLLLFRYYVGCDAIFNQANGTLESPAYGVEDYPPNQVGWEIVFKDYESTTITTQECTYRVRHPEGGRLSMRFNDLQLHSSDKIEVRDRTAILEVETGKRK